MSQGWRLRLRAQSTMRQASIFGAVWLARGTGAGRVLPHADEDAMTLHLATIGEAVTPDAQAVVIVDGAGWHKPGGRLTLPDTVSIVILPPYSPQLNPQENIWQDLCQNPPVQPRVQHRRGHRRCFLRRLDSLDEPAGQDHLNRHTTMGKRGHDLMPLA
ncbi:MAG: transposase [Defluviicoccus sp.]|nr:MAG: transposase [Defluviicoccus sp.]